MVRLIVVGSLILAVACAPASTEPEGSAPSTPVPPGISQAFVVTAGGPARDRGIGVAETADGGLVAVGYSSSPPAHGEDVYVVRIDRLGSVSWERWYGGAGRDHGWAVLEAPDLGLVILGSTDSVGAGGMDLYLIRTDAAGEILWERTFGGSGDDFGWGVVADRAGGYLLVGETPSGDGSGRDGLVVAVGPDGVERWSRTLGGEGEDRLFSIDSDGSRVAVAGTTTTQSMGERDAFVVLLDEAGNMVSELRFGTSGDDVAHSVRFLGDGALLATGYTDGRGGPDADVWALVFEADGAVRWEALYGEGGDDRAIAGVPLVDGRTVLVGATTGFGAVGSDALVVVVDASGEVVAHRLFGGGRTDTGYAVIEASDGSIVIVGETSSEGAGGGDLWVVKTDVTWERTDDR